MTPPYLQENPYKVVIEFKKGNAGFSGRVIELVYVPQVLPYQLKLRIPLEVRTSCTGGVVCTCLWEKGPREGTSCVNFHSFNMRSSYAFNVTKTCHSTFDFTRWLNSTLLWSNNYTCAQRYGDHSWCKYKTWQR